MEHKILIVDDAENIRVMVRAAFQNDYAVIAAADGHAAVELVKKERPELVFLDIDMPGLGGVEALKLIKESGVPVIIWMLTGVEDLAVVSKTLAMGAAGYITKPFQVEILRRVALNAFIDLDGEEKPSVRSWTVKKKRGEPGP